MEREVHLEMANADLKGLKLGDELTVTIKGKVKELVAGAPPTGNDKLGIGVKGSAPPARMRLTISSQKFSRTGNTFEKLAVADERDD